MYRAVTLAALRAGIDLESDQASFGELVEGLTRRDPAPTASCSMART